jgi:hypothetical protein
MKRLKISEKQAALLRGLKNGKTIKITLEQYNRLFNPINESNEVKGGLNRVDKTFKKSFSDVAVKNLDENDFNITKPNKDVPPLNKKVMHRDPIKEDIFSPELHQAVSHLIYNIYQNPSQAGLDPFWVKHGLTWGDINSYLTSLGLLITGIKGLELAKKYKGRVFGTPKDAINTVEKSLGVLVAKKANRLKDPNGQQLMTKNVEMEEASNYAPGTENDPNAPWNQKDGKPIEAIGPKLYTTIAMNKEIAILKDAAGALHVFDYSNVDPAEFGDIDRIIPDDITNYVNNNAKTLSHGVGLPDFEAGKDLVKIDPALRHELVQLYDKNNSLTQALSTISEMTSAGASATGGSSGPFVGPLNMPIVKRKIPVVAEGPVAGSSATGGSSGPYDANALPNITRDGTFKKNKKKSRAEVSTQYPHGKFVEMDSCTQLNNNKEAQNGGCNGGAVSNVVKQKKGKGSIISKDALLETIINELGLNDWKVRNIVDHLNVADDVEFERCFYLMTGGKNMKKVPNPKDYLAKCIQEMGKEDVDYFYPHVVG